MLQLFRKKKEWLKWVLVLVIFGLGFTTVLFFVRTPSGTMGGIGVQEVALVAGEQITVSQYRRRYQQLLELYRQMYNLDRQDPKIVKQLGIGQQTLNQLISQYAALNEAQAFGLSVTEQELVDEITRLPVFQEDGRFIGSTRYQQILQSNNLTANEFETSLRRDILAGKFRDVITDGIVATTTEVRQAFVEANQEVKLEYVAFDPARMDVKRPTQEELQDYYDEHQDDFRRPEQRQIDYLLIYQDPDDVQVGEEQIQAEMGNLAAEEHVRVRHILISTSEGATAAHKEAAGLQRRLQKGADFAELARRHSADEASALRGGDLGFFGRGKMVPEFEQAAFALKPGELSGLVKSPFGFHIIRSIAKTGADQEAQRPVAEFNARSKEADKRAAALAEEVIQALKDGSRLDEAAEKYSFRLYESEYFDDASGIPGLGVGNDFLQEVFSLSPAQWTKPYNIEGVYLIGELEDIRAAEIPDLSQIREEVAGRYRQDRVENLAEEEAKKFAEEAENAESFADAVKKNRLQVVTTDFFKKGVNIDDTLRFSPSVQDQAFALDLGAVSTPVQVTDKYVVFRVAERASLDEEKFEQEKPELYERLTRQKRSEFYMGYVQNVVDELRRNDQIVINQPLLDDLTGL